MPEVVLRDGTTATRFEMEHVYGALGIIIAMNLTRARRLTDHWELSAHDSYPLVRRCMPSDLFLLFHSRFFRLVFAAPINEQHPEYKSNQRIRYIHRGQCQSAVALAIEALVCLCWNIQPYLLHASNCLPTSRLFVFGIFDDILTATASSSRVFLPSSCVACLHVSDARNFSIHRDHAVSITAPTRREFVDLQNTAWNIFVEWSKALSEECKGAIEEHGSEGDTGMEGGGEGLRGARSGRVGEDTPFTLEELVEFAALVQKLVRIERAEWDRRLSYHLMSMCQVGRKDKPGA